MYAPTAPNTMSGKGAGPQKKVTAFTHQGTHTFWKCILGEVLLCRWKPIWVTVIHVSGAKAESAQLGTNDLGLQEGQV